MDVRQRMGITRKQTVSEHLVQSVAAADVTALPVRPGRSPKPHIKSPGGATLWKSNPPSLTIPPRAKLIYIVPVVILVLAVVLGKNYDWPQRLLPAAILFVMSFVLVWLLDRPARMRLRMSWRVTKRIKKAQFLSNE